MHIVIIGNGISGITASRFIRKLSDHRITVVSSETEYFFSRTALMYLYMGHMRFKDLQPYQPWFWEKNRIDLVKGYVEKVDMNSKVLHLADGENISYDKLIISAGSKPNKFGWPGQDLKAVGGLVSYQDLENMEAYSTGLRRAVVVGGGLIGIEMAEMFHSRHIPVTMLVREESYWNAVLPSEESRMVNREIINHGIDLRLSSELKEIIDDGNGRACAVLTSEGERIDCGFVGLTAGVRPNVDFLKGTPLEIDKGIMVDEYLATNVPDVYAIGDCAQLRHPPPNRKPIEAVWYVGRIMGEHVAHNICGQSVAYDPGIWFNSAKFMDIEYMVYGDVQTNMPEDQEALYWEHPGGRKSIRIIYNKKDRHVTGFNLMGIRYRHEVCDAWLKEKISIEAVLQNLGLANFDPELSAQHEQALVNLYNRQHGTALKLKERRGLGRVIRFLWGRERGVRETKVKE